MATSSIAATEREDIRRTVVESLTDHLEAMKQLEIERALQYFAHREDVVYADNGDIVFGWDAIEEKYHDFPRQVAEIISIELGDPIVHVLSLDAASLTVTFRERFLLTSGEQTHVQGNWTVVWARFDGAWQILQVGAAHVPVSG